MGSSQFLTRTLDRVRTAMSLHVLAYNVKRAIAIFGVAVATGGPSLSARVSRQPIPLDIRANPPPL
jgi:hypothetical protein